MAEPQRASREGVTATERVYRAIRQRILKGEYGAGESLREETLAGELDISRTPIREALRRLVSEGWVEILPHRGARVVGWTRDDVNEVFELRSMLESHAVRRAASRISLAHCARLRDLADQMERLCESPEPRARDRIAELNDAFHAVLMEAADSPRLQRLVAAVVQAPVTRRSFYHYEDPELERSMGHHRELIAALEAGDAGWAASVMRAHILAARTAQLRHSDRHIEADQ